MILEFINGILITIIAILMLIYVVIRIIDLVKYNNERLNKRIRREILNELTRILEKCEEERK